jgi:DNA polymerase I-like protein with 3'-5' exonuclease and polymerase domains
MPELVQQLRPLDLSGLTPRLNVTLVNNAAGLLLLNDYISRKRAKKDFFIGLDTETDMCSDFWFRRCRTIQLGDRDEQFVIDLLAFAGSKDRLCATQGEYGANCNGVYDPVFDVLTPVLCSKEFLKIGQNLSFDYTVFWWNFGKRIWHLYSTDMAERVIQAGTIALKKMAEFSMSSIAARYFHLLIDKTLQESFDLETPLTKQQIEYAAFDVRFPHAMRQAQINIMTVDQLLTTAQIENDAIGTFTDMHLNGQNLDDDRWKARIQHVLERREGELKILDEGFIPIVGRKNEQIDEVEIERRYKHWKEDFELPTQLEISLAAQKRLEKNKEKKAEIGALLEAEKKKRAADKAVAHAAYSELSKQRTVWKNKFEECEGEAYINYDSRDQLLAALQQMPGMRTVKDTTDDTLLRYNDRLLIQTLRKFKKGKKDTGTYGLQWTQRWITKPLAKEGWRHPVDGRLHCTFNQLEAETGRTSSSKPNAQNLPKDDEVRACFICDPPNPKIRVSVCCDADTYTINSKYTCMHCKEYCNTKDEEMVIVTCDMSGAELRIIAELANATSWINAFNKGWDVHSVSTEILEPEKWPALACKGGEKFFDKEKNKGVILPPCAYYEKDSNGELKRQKCKCPGHVELRQKTKTINFLLCYGGGPDALADDLGITVDAAKELIRQHEEAFPDVWSYLERSGKLAKSMREARDMFGRRRAFPVPTRDIAKQWWITEHEDSLELSEPEKEASIFRFKTSQLREPTKDELHQLTHRNPTEKEIDRALYALAGSVERKGKNMSIQGTNASIAKRAIGCGFDASGQPYLWHQLPQYRAKVQNFVHDELLVGCPKRYGQQVAELIESAFRRAAAEVMHSVVMQSEYHIASRWMK